MLPFAAALALVIATSAAAQIPNSGTICGTVLDENGDPAQHVIIVAHYLSPHSGPLPTTQSYNTGKYCMDTVPFGQTMLSVDDPDRGYPSMWNSFYNPKPLDQQTNNIADLSASHPEVTVDLRIPYKAAFLTVHLTDAVTGASKSSMSYEMKAEATSGDRTISGSQKTADALLVPPNENVLLKVGAPGYREWPYDGSPGYLVNLSPGERKTFDVPLQPK
jgi:hypothetical protein